MAGNHKQFSLEELFPEYYRGLRDELELFTGRPESENNLSTEEMQLKQHVLKVDYRPLDTRYCMLNKSASKFTGTVQNSLAGPNIFLNVAPESNVPASSFLTRNPASVSFLSEEETTYIFPLYLYEENHTLVEPVSKKLNLNGKIINTFSACLGLAYVPDIIIPGNVCMAADAEVRMEFRITFSAMDILDYIYAVAFSKPPESSEKRFPEIHYPRNTDLFWQVVSLGTTLRKIHLLESYMPKESLPGFPVEGGNRITRKITSASLEPVTYSHGMVSINDRQFFAGIASDAWELSIGNYNPAQLWLVNRYKSVLTPKDIQHYKTLIAVLSETSRIIKKLRQLLG